MSKAPESADLVKLQKYRDGFRKSIGYQNGKQRVFCFPGGDETTARSQAFQLMKQWDTRPAGINDWLELEKAENYVNNVVRVLEKKAKESLQNTVTKAARAVAIAKEQNITLKTGYTVAAAKTAYLESMKKRVGLVGSLGIEKWTSKQVEHRLNRALEFLPPEITHLSEINYLNLETLIYALAARPFKKPNPLASKDVQEKQKKEHVSARTAIGWIDEINAFLRWCAEEERINYVMPRHVSHLFSITPEAEEQNLITFTQEQIHQMWNATIAKNAYVGDKGKIRRLYLLLGLNCGFYSVDIATLKAEHIITEPDGTRYCWKLRRKTRKTNKKLVRTKWVLWPETAALLDEYLPLDVSAQAIRSAWNRLTNASGVRISHSHLRDTGSQFMEACGGQEMSDTYLAHARPGVTDSYSHPDWQRLTDALMKFYSQFVQSAIAIQPTGK